MAKHTIVLIPGDGIGPEVTRAARRVIEAAGLPVEWVELPAGAAAIEQGLDNVLPPVSKTYSGFPASPRGSHRRTGPPRSQSSSKCPSFFKSAKL